MPLSKLDYIPGDYDAVSSQAMDDIPINNTWYHFSVDGFKHAMSDLVLVSDGDTLVLGTDYELATDTNYTSEESGQSGKTVYAMWRIINDVYEGLTMTVSGNNFGAYISNEVIENRHGYVQLESTVQNPTGSQAYALPVLSADIDKIINIVIRYYNAPSGEYIFFSPFSSAYGTIYTGATYVTLDLIWSGIASDLAPDEVASTDPILVTVYVKES